MALYPMRGGGGKLEETVLWTNPSPSSSSGWSSAEVALSDAKSNYDFIKFVFAYSYSALTSTEEVVYPTSMLATFGSTGFRGASAVYTSANLRNFFRHIDSGSDDTHVGIRYCYQLEQAGSWSQQNLMLIPLKVIGIKQTSGGGTIDPPALVDTVLWTNSSPSSSFSAQTVTLSDDVSNYDYIKIKYGYSTVNYSSGNAVSSMLTSLEDIEKWHLSDSTQHCIGVLGVQASNNNQYSRNVFLQDVDKIYFGNDYQTATNNLANDTVIPLQIYGVKKTNDYKSITSFSGSTAKANSFTAIVGHRYLIVASALTGGGTTVTGLNVEDQTPLLVTSSSSNMNAQTMGVIGTATSTTVTVYIHQATYENIIWVDLTE